MFFNEIKLKEQQDCLRIPTEFRSQEEIDKITKLLKQQKTLEKMFNVNPTDTMQKYLSRCSTIRNYKNNALIQRKGSECRNVYFILSGKAKLQIDKQDEESGEEWKVSSKYLVSVVSNVESGQKVGDHFIQDKNGIIKNERHNLTALTSEDSLLLILSCADMWNILHDQPVAPFQWVCERLVQVCPSITKIDPLELSLILDHVQVSRFKKGTLICEQRSSESDVHILHKGKIEVIWEDEDGKFYAVTKLDEKQSWYIGIEAYEVDTETAPVYLLALEDCICLHIRKADKEEFKKIAQDLKTKYQQQKMTAENLIEQMVDEEHEVNLLQRQADLKKAAAKVASDKIQIDLMDSLAQEETAEDTENDAKLLMTSGISKRNLDNVEALNSEQLESLKKLRSMGLYLRSMDQTEATEKSTNFTDEDIQHLENMNEMKNKKTGKTAVNIMLGKGNF